MQSRIESVEAQTERKLWSHVMSQVQFQIGGQVIRLVRNQVKEQVDDPARNLICQVIRQA